MNRANVIGPSRRISSRIRAARSSSWPTDPRSGGGTRRRPGVSVHAPPMMRRTPGPTSVWPPSRIGIGAVAAEAVSSRSHGSAIRSDSSRSEANRSSGAGQAASSAPSRWARRTRVSTMAASASRARWSPNEPGPSRSRSAPRMDAGLAAARMRTRTRLGKPARSTQAAFLDQRPSPRRRVTLEPGQRRRRRPAGDEELGSAVARDAPDGREPRPQRAEVDVGLRRVRHVAGQHEVERAVDVHAEPPAATRSVDLVAGDLLSQRGSALSPGRSGMAGSSSDPSDRDDVGRSTGCWRGLVRPRPRRDRRTLVDRRASRAGPTPSPGRRARASRPPGPDETRAVATPNDRRVGRAADDRDVLRAGGARSRVDGVRRVVARASVTHRTSGPD